jgi:hypothetical protein
MRRRATDVPCSTRWLGQRCYRNGSREMKLLPIVDVLIVCVIAALMGFTLPTHAKNVKKSKSILPPPEFDHFYRGNISVKRDSAWSAPCRPISLSGRLGCAFPPDKSNDECFVFMAPREEIEEAGYTENAVWRHLMARCNGWRNPQPLRAKDSD